MNQITYHKSGRTLTRQLESLYTSWKQGKLPQQDFCLALQVAERGEQALRHTSPNRQKYILSLLAV